MNNFAEDESFVAQNIQSARIHKYDEEGKKIGTFNIKNPHYTQEIENLSEAIIAEMKEYAPVYPFITREQCKDPHLLVVDLADLHVGKLCSAFETGEEYNAQIAVKRAKE